MPGAAWLQYIVSRGTKSWAETEERSVRRPDTLDLLSSLPSAVPTMRLLQDSSRLPFCFFLVALPILVVLDIFPLQVLPDIVRPDSSCNSFLVSCQTNPLLVG